jgi:hypothetical protein
VVEAVLHQAVPEWAAVAVTGKAERLEIAQVHLVEEVQLPVEVPARQVIPVQRLVLHLRAVLVAELLLAVPKAAAVVAADTSAAAAEVINLVQILMKMEEAVVDRDSLVLDQHKLRIQSKVVVEK